MTKTIGIWWISYYVDKFGHYVGGVKDGKSYSQGRNTWSDGEVYEGSWKDDKRDSKMAQFMREDINITNSTAMGSTHMQKAQYMRAAGKIADSTAKGSTHCQVA